jgi:hypothetical protein
MSEQNALEVVPPDQYLVSKSALFTFETCPRRFKYGNLLKLDFDADPNTQNSKLSDGLKYHDLFAKAFMHVKQPEAGTLLQQMFPVEMQNDAICKSFADSEEKRLAILGPEKWRPAFTELYVENLNERMKGFIDRVDWISRDSPQFELAGCEGYMITDYKPTGTELREEMAFYHIPALATLKAPIVLHACYGYRDGNWRTWLPQNSIIEQIKQRKNAVLSAIKVDNLKRCETYYCKWCPYPLRCLSEDTSEINEANVLDILSEKSNT